MPSAEKEESIHEAYMVEGPVTVFDFAERRTAEITEVLKNGFCWRSVTIMMYFFYSYRPGATPSAPVRHPNQPGPPQTATHPVKPL